MLQSFTKQTLFLTEFKSFINVPAAAIQSSLLIMASKRQDVQRTPPERKANTAMDIVKEAMGSHISFQQSFTRRELLGSGGDGTVYKYTHSYSNLVVAIKRPLSSLGKCNKTILHEIATLEFLGHHPHIVTMLASSTRNYGVGVAIVMECCKLGDLIRYRELWCKQERARGKPERPSELTVWKLLRDMSLGLDYLHNKKNIRYVHNDFKPGNILVTYPEDWKKEDGVPAEPVFKITDFGRLTPFPTVQGFQTTHFKGTPEYAPPFEERRGAVRPSADIWGLGATIQLFVLGALPTISRETFIKSRQEAGENYPRASDHAAWRSDEWRWRIPTLYRPLNVSKEVLKKEYDLASPPQDHAPLSDQLNAWYFMMWREDRRLRIKSSELVKFVVPRIAKEMEILRSRLEAEAKLEEAADLRQRVLNLRAAYENLTT